MYRQYRKIEEGEFFVIFADTSAGGNDYNACQFLSKTHLDVPLVFHHRGIANEMTNSIFPTIERIFDTTKVKPVVAYETNNGGIFELERLSQLNRLGKYEIYKQQSHGTLWSAETPKIGWTTSVATRPKMIQDLKECIDKKLLRLYDRPTVTELFSFIISQSGKPQAERNSHDDLVMSLAGAWQLFQNCNEQFEVDSLDVPDDSYLFKGGTY
jgi:hypothetical protein